MNFIDKKSLKVRLDAFIADNRKHFIEMFDESHMARVLLHTPWYGLTAEYDKLFGPDRSAS
jgi:hypothetical protein